MFPCDGYHMSVIADTCDGFVSILEEIVKRHYEVTIQKDCGLRRVRMEVSKFSFFN